MSEIAHRTRSHVSIGDDVLNDNLDFPDVDPNLYQNPNSVNDPDYKDFLNRIYSETVEPNTDTNTDTNADETDPVYVHNDDILSHGWKFNLDEEFQRQQPREATYGPEVARVLNQQLRQHIQLLTQTYLLTKSMKNMQNEADAAKEHLNSYMKIFKDRRKPSNLLPAIQLVADFGTPKDLLSSVRFNWRHLQVPEVVKTLINQNPNIFPYADLLPQVAFSRLPDKLVTKKPKIIFTPNEDKLLALALNEFKGESSQYAYIASLLLAAKTKLQINNHIKNIKRSSGNEDNPIKLYFSHGSLPDVDLDSDNRLRDCNHLNGERDSVRESLSSTSSGGGSSNNDISDIARTPKVEMNMEDCELKMTPVAAPATTVNLSDPEPPPAGMLLYDCGGDGGGHVVNNECDIVLEPMNVDDCGLANETNMDDLMAASTTISKHNNNNNNNISEKNIKSLKLRKSMVDLMSHTFLISEEMGDLIVHDFLRVSQEKLTERNHIHLLQLLSDLMRKEAKKDNESAQSSARIYNDITEFLKKIEAPNELRERLVLFLNLESAIECNCAPSYLHWMRCFQFFQHIELNHEGEGFEKKLSKLIDALQKEDPHKIKLATSHLINKHPLLKRDYESLDLNGKPHSSFFICEDDFDDQTLPFTLFESNQKDCIQYEHFEHKLTPDEMNYASQSCPCKCHQGLMHQQQQQQHCGKCNLKFMKSRMYLVNKIKPCLAEFTYIDRQPDPTTPPVAPHTSRVEEPTPAPPLPPPPPPIGEMINIVPPVEWTFEEDKEILEFCRAKAEQNDESVSFDTVTFEELVTRRRTSNNQGVAYEKSAIQIAERFNQLMEMYKRDE